MGIFSKLGKKVKDKAIGIALKTQLKKLPPEQREMFEALFNENPELLEKMALESQSLMKTGESEMSAMMKVGKKYQKELTETLSRAGIDPRKMQGGNTPSGSGPF